MRRNRLEINFGCRAFGFFLILCLTACECEFDYEYSLTNDCDSDVEVYWETYEGRDSLTIGVGESSFLFQTNHGLEPCKLGPSKDDVDEDIINFQVLKGDTIQSTKNYLKSSSWNYSENDDNGFYSAVVNQADFEN